MKILVFLSENSQILVVKFSIYLNRGVFGMDIHRRYRSVGTKHDLFTVYSVLNVCHLSAV